MNTLAKKPIIFAVMIMLFLSACSSFSISSKSGDIEVNTKTDQPSVIVNNNIKNMP